NEGWVRTIVRVRDRDGRTVTFKPALWQQGARPALAGLRVLAANQGIALDDRTARALERATDREGVPPGWASLAIAGGDLELAEPAVPMETIASRISDPALTSGSRNLYRIGPSALFDRHNTRAVQRDAGKLVDGLLVQWSDRGGLRDEVYLERFASALDAKR